MASRHPAVFASVVRRAIKRTATVHALRMRLGAIKARRAAVQEASFQAHVAHMLERLDHGRDVAFLGEYFAQETLQAHVARMLVVADCEANTVHTSNPHVVAMVQADMRDMWTTGYRVGR